MKFPLGIVADEIDRDFAKAVKIGTSLGIRRYEVRHLVSGRAPMCDEAELREVQRVAADEGVEITALSPGLFKLVDGATSFRREMSEVYPRAAEWAKRWNLPGLIVFGFLRGTVGVGAMFAEAEARAAADGLKLFVEPEPVCEIGTARAAAALGLKINYDPGNVAWLEDRDPIAEFEAAAPFIANVHVKDLTHGGENPEWVPAGEGLIDWRAHLAALRGIGYAGRISLEPHMDGRPETIRRCIDAFSKCWGE